ncbi:c-type cytochrome [Luteimonas vadosa]|uniref:C-type cytochrome n=1 Tax=Luteimonas vadosa TaxID=1165507 RepID=A0ABP9DV57_9GAMM
MRNARAYAFAGFAALVAGAVAYAQTTVMPLPENEPVETMPLDANAVAALAQANPGDPKAGATKAGACAACHGLDGNGTDPAIYPRIAGHSERYIARQLALFKSGERVNAIMQPYAAPLSAQDMRDLGAYFATQETGAGIADDTEIAEGPYAGMKFYQVGEKLFRSGDVARGIPACMACHGPDGAGNPGPPYPHVAGQQAWYSARRLQEYRAGETSERDRTQFAIMASVAESLTDEEISALASYLQGLHARPDAAMLAAIARMPAAAAPAPPAPPATPATLPPSTGGEVQDEAAAVDETPSQGS